MPTTERVQATTNQVPTEDPNMALSKIGVSQGKQTTIVRGNTVVATTSSNRNKSKGEESWDTEGGQGLECLINDVTLRHQLWNQLAQVGTNVQDAWLLSGDFNNVLTSEDRIGAPEDKRVYSNIDWAMGNYVWLQQYSHIEAEFMDPGVSDHSPILIHTSQHKKGLHPKPLKLYKNVMEHPEFTNIVQEEKEILTELEKWSHIEEQVLQQKLRATWIECGDSNTKYFHAQWKIRTSKNHIASIYNANGIKLTDPIQIEEEFISFFTNLMGESGETHRCSDAAVVKQGRCLDQQQKEVLVKNITNEEILAAMKDMPHDKAPWVDGFSIKFFTTQWTIVGLKYVLQSRNSLKRAKCIEA
ncbi:PREDICTED: uncharacterized protein LOC109212693 [Nicotiana attenuata]|uniref:uncharacterized protein LOC109212693 n=1 Tax=Nicotiana attenuata TaxID=49451 RepID=UPI000904E5A8|nr:PREDICTED: uncharacterized protein LOC109212693 [Nicotiana attenuata]